MPGMHMLCYAYAMCNAYAPAQEQTLMGSNMKAPNKVAH